MFGSLKKDALAFLVCALLVVGAWVAVTYVHVHRYENMSDNQAFAQSNKLFGDHEKACYEAGGYWVVGFADAYCTVAYTPPDTSWYIAPKPNGWYGVWELVFALLAALGISAAVMGFAILIALVLEVPYIYHELRKKRSNK